MLTWLYLLDLGSVVVVVAAVVVVVLFLLCACLIINLLLVYVRRVCVNTNGDHDDDADVGWLCQANSS